MYVLSLINLLYWHILVADEKKKQTSGKCRLTNRSSEPRLWWLWRHWLKMKWGQTVEPTAVFTETLLLGPRTPNKGLTLPVCLCPDWLCPSSTVYWFKQYSLQPETCQIPSCNQAKSLQLYHWKLQLWECTQTKHFIIILTFSPLKQFS